nr:MAG TPA: hypothetical protein [Caudoviricetes sp.]
MIIVFTDKSLIKLFDKSFHIYSFKLIISLKHYYLHRL